MSVNIDAIKTNTQAIIDSPATLQQMELVRLQEIVNQSVALGLTSAELQAEITRRAANPSSEDEIYALSTMAYALTPKSGTGGGSTLPVGAMQQFASRDVIIEENGETWVKTGFVVNEPGSFETSVAHFNAFTPKTGQETPFNSIKSGFDFYNNKIYAVNYTSNGIDILENGKITGKIGFDHSNIRDITIDAATGHIFGACYNPDQVVEFSPLGAVLQTHAVVESGESRNIYGIAKNSTHFFMVDNSNEEVLQYDLNWNRVAVFDIDTAVAGGLTHIAADETHLFITNNETSGTAGNIAKLEIANPTNIVGTGNITMGSTLGIAIDGDDILVSSRTHSYNVGIRRFSKDLSSKYRINVGEIAYGVCVVDDHYFVTTGSKVKKYSRDGQLVATYEPNIGNEIYGISHRKGKFYISGEGYIRIFNESFQLESEKAISIPPGATASTKMYDMCWVEDQLYVTFYASTAPSASQKHVAVYNEFLTKTADFQATLYYLTGIAFKNGRFLMHGRSSGSTHNFRLVDANMQIINGSLFERSDYLAPGNNIFGMDFDGDDVVMALHGRKHIEIFTPRYFAGSTIEVTGEAGAYYTRVK